MGLSTIRRRGWFAVVVGGAVASCGSRTGLFGDDAGTSESPPGPPDGGFDSARDVVPPIDVVAIDVDRRDCPDASDATSIYVVTADKKLFSFFPPDLSFKLVGDLECPSAEAYAPLSMAVDRAGVAYVLYTNEALFRVSTETAACEATSFVPPQGEYVPYGMGFASNVGGAAERLYVTNNSGLFQDAAQLNGLGTIDTNSFALTVVGPFGTTIHRSELTSTGDGRLFAFWPDNYKTGVSHLSEVNKTTGQLLATTDLPIGTRHNAWPMVFWGGAFWIFTTDGAVSRFNPADGTTTTSLTTLPLTSIVGAGASSCAPQH